MSKLVGLKPRELRRKVMIKARMRVGASWSDALILNMSSRGLMVRSERPPSRGSFLEIRRGPYVIVARVIWSDSDRFGVIAQDPVPADDLIGDPDGASNKKAVAADSMDRRAAPRPPEVRHELSRHSARAAQFIAIVLGCGFLAILAANAVVEVVARPLGAAQAALSTGN